MVAGSEDYTVSVLKNDTVEIRTAIPMAWDTSTVDDGWWNITVIVTDVATNIVSQDEVIVYIQNVEAPTNIYYCSSQSEIEGALDTIGTGHGTIIITENITLSSTINLDDGGRYIIRGAGPITLNRNASDDDTFSVTNVQSLTIEDLIIDASNITYAGACGIRIWEGNDNPVYIQNVQIGGGGEGIGVKGRSENIWIQNCYINGFRTGIYLDRNAYCHVLDNSLFDMVVGSGFAYGIRLYESDSNTITGNSVKNIYSDWAAYGISLSNSYYNTISGNSVNTTVSGGSNDGNGIYLYHSDYNTLTGNSVINIDPATGDGYGILLYSCDYNTVVGNMTDNCKTDGVLDFHPGTNVIDHNIEA